MLHSQMQGGASFCLQGKDGKDGNMWGFFMFGLLLFLVKPFLVLEYKHVANC